MDPATPVPVRDDARTVPSVAPPRVTIAEDDDDVRAALAGLFARDGFDVTHLADGNALVEHLMRSREQDQVPDLVILDHRMPGWCGLEILEAMQATGWRLPVIVITAFGPEVTDPARALGARAVFEKPFDPDDLRTAVYYWLGRNDTPVPAARGSRTERVRVLDLACATCGGRDDVRLPALGEGVYFCEDCWERARPPALGEDLGGGD